MNNPHGGKLISKQTSKYSAGYDLIIQIDDDTAKDVINIAVGLYSPLEGFMNKDDYENVLDKSRLANNLAWTIPIILDVTDDIAKQIKLGTKLLLAHKKSGLEAILIVEDKYKLDPEKYAKSIFTTTDKNHPGVKAIYERNKNLIGGEIYLIRKGKIVFPTYNLTPKETREVFEKNGWKTIVGFQTRNPAHVAHEFIQKMALEFVDGLFVNPIMGHKKSGDFKDEVILEVYKELTSRFYPKNSSFISIFPSRMNYAGPKEAIHHAIIRKNYGCTHFIVGRDHAGVGDYYDKFAAHKIFDQFDDIGITPMKVSAAFYCHRCGIYTTGKICPHNEIYHVSPSGTEVRKAILSRDYNSLKNVMRDEVLDIIFSYNKPFVE